MERHTRIPPFKLLLTMEEAAQTLSLGRTSLYALVMRGKIVSVKLGRRRLVPIAALEQFVAQQVSMQEAS